MVNIITKSNIIDINYDIFWCGREKEHTMLLVRKVPAEQRQFLL